MGIQIKWLRVLLHKGFHNTGLPSSDLREQVASCLVAVFSRTPFPPPSPEKETSKAYQPGFRASLCLGDNYCQIRSAGDCSATVKEWYFPPTCVQTKRSSPLLSVGTWAGP